MKKKQWLLIEILAAVLAIIVLAAVMVPKFLASQSVNTPAHIPDDNFRLYMERIFQLEPGTPYSRADAAEKSVRTNISPNVEYFKISSVKGINLFTGTRSVFIRDNFLREIDVSALTNLERMDVCGNQIRTLTLPQSNELKYLAVLNNRLEKLDLQSVPNLERLMSSQNFIKELLVTNNHKLTMLDVSYNNLKRVDLSNNTKLRLVALNNNPLTELILPRDASISQLVLSNTKLKRLPDVSALKWLRALDYRGNAIHPDDLDTLKKLEERIGASDAGEGSSVLSGVAYDKPQ